MNDEIKEYLKETAERLAKNIKSLRTENGLTQKQMAKKLNISVYCLRKMEKAELPKTLTHKTLIDICEIFGKTPSEMLEM